jgi:aromatic ring-opening dioxygenase catalytic subunit (LigB family)
VQLGLRGDLDPDAHLRAGRQLAPLRDEGVLILGSGSSYHNLRRFDASAAAPSREFDDWLQETLVDLRPAQRRQRLLEWERAPAARVAHPREEHLLPLMVAVGAASDETGHNTYSQRDFAGSLAMSGYQFGGNEEGAATISQTAR